jgi:hypothetical protein
VCHCRCPFERFSFLNQGSIAQSHEYRGEGPFAAVHAYWRGGCSAGAVPRRLLLIAGDVVSAEGEAHRSAAQGAVDGVVGLLVLGQFPAGGFPGRQAEEVAIRPLSVGVKWAVRCRVDFPGNRWPGR